MHGNKAYPSTQPPAYSTLDGTPAPAHSWWDPRGWPLWGKIGAVALIIGVIVGIIVGAVVGTKESHDNSYPDYTQLNYTIVDRYEGTSFFDNFDYYNTYDPADGFVHYVPNTTASQYNLTYATSDRAVLRVDNTDENDSSTGRFSVRITSKKQYDTGLFVFDVYHTPYACSTWPALWLSDPANWPENGEIDVIEAVEQGNKGNQMTLHTSKGCKMDAKRKEYGTVSGKNCWNGTDDNAGCGVKGATDTYGEEFNADGGGIYAMELRDAGIRIWVFTRSAIPNDLVSGNDSSPDPSGWGEALADFPSTNCDISSHFKNQSIIANIDLCGDWAGTTSVYSTEYGCPGTCENFVANNSTGYDTAFWEFGSFRVYSSD